MTPYAIWFWKKIPLLSFVQFPWRILSVIAVVQVLCICGSSVLLENLKSYQRIALLSFIVFIFPFVHGEQFIGQKVSVDSKTIASPYEKKRLTAFFKDGSRGNEYFPKSAARSNFKKKTRLGMHLVQRNPGGPLQENVGSTPYHIRYTLSNSTPVRITINQFYFPGWKVILNENPIHRSVLE
jgi:hypothetical protein